LFHPSLTCDESRLCRFRPFPLFCSSLCSRSLFVLPSPPPAGFPFLEPGGPVSRPFPPLLPRLTSPWTFYSVVVNRPIAFCRSSAALIPHSENKWGEPSVPCFYFLSSRLYYYCLSGVLALIVPPPHRVNVPFFIYLTSSAPRERPDDLCPSCLHSAILLRAEITGALLTAIEPWTTVLQLAPLVCGSFEEVPHSVCSAKLRSSGQDRRLLLSRLAATAFGGV